MKATMTKAEYREFVEAVDEIKAKANINFCTKLLIYVRRKNEDFQFYFLQRGNYHP